MRNTIIAAVLLSIGFTVSAAEVTVDVNQVSTDGIGNSIGQVVIEETPYGLLFTPNLKNLPAGIHGFHVHENASCATTEKDGVKTPAGAAGGHLDPEKTGQHLGPYNAKGHLGDLPAIYVNAEGVANYPVLAPRLTKLSQVNQHALMVHVGGDNHSDKPVTLGGGGARMACGVIQISQ